MRVSRQAVGVSARLERTPGTPCAPGGTKALRQRAIARISGPCRARSNEPKAPYARLADIEDELAHAQSPQCVAAPCRR